MTEAITAYTFPTVHAARQYIEARVAERNRVKLAMHALRHRFARAFPVHPPARLVLRAGGGICWRLRGRVAGAQPVFDLGGEIGRALLSRLSPAMRHAFLQFEEERSALDMRWKILNTEVRCLENWAARKRALQALRKSFCVDI